MLRTRELDTIEIYPWGEGHVILRQPLLTEGERIIILNPADIKLLLEWLPVAAILNRLEQLGVQVTVVGDRLRFEPASVIPPDLRDEIRARKADLMATLIMADQSRVQGTTFPSGS